MTFDAHILDGFNSFLLAVAVTQPSEQTNKVGRAFDAFVVVMLIIGFLRGKKRGVSEEWYDLLKWLVALGAAAYGYKPLGDWLNKKASYIPSVIAYITCYLIVVIVVNTIFAAIKGKMGERFFKSDLFGRAEYPLGMLAGIVRFGCMVLMLLALLNVFVLDHAKIAKKEEFQDKDMGMTIIPSQEAMHFGIFSNSFSGHWVKENIKILLIEPTKYASNSGDTNRTDEVIDDAIKQPPKK